MIVPGSNLLNIAMGVITPQWVLWSQDQGRVTNAVGKLVTQYGFPVAVRGSFQPMSRSQIQRDGFDLSSTYATFYASEPLRPVERGITGDRFAYGGSLWDAVEGQDWFNQDGWRAPVLIRVGPYVG